MLADGLKLILTHWNNDLFRDNNGQCDRVEMYIGRPQFQKKYEGQGLIAILT